MSSISAVKITLDHSFKKIPEWKNDASLLTRHVATRALTISCIPLEIINIISKLGSLFINSAIKTGVKISKLFFSKSQSVNQLDSKLPTYGKLLMTAVKVMKAVIGVIFTALLNPLSPIANYWLHVKLGLIKEKAPEKQKEAEIKPVEQPILKEAEINTTEKPVIKEAEIKTAEQHTIVEIKKPEQPAVVEIKITDQTAPKEKKNYQLNSPI